MLQESECLTWEIGREVFRCRRGRILYANKVGPHVAYEEYSKFLLLAWIMDVEERGKGQPSPSPPTFTFWSICNAKATTAPCPYAYKVRLQASINVPCGAIAYTCGIIALAISSKLRASRASSTLCVPSLLMTIVNTTPSSSSLPPGLAIKIGSHGQLSPDFGYHRMTSPVCQSDFAKPLNSAM